VGSKKQRVGRNFKSSPGLLRYQYPALSSVVMQKHDVAGVGSGLGYSLIEIKVERILGG